MAESQKSEAEPELGTVSEIFETIPIAETKDKLQSVSISISAITVNMSEEPVAGNPHGGFCEGRGFLISRK